MTDKPPGPLGFNGAVLRVDLDSRKISVDYPPLDFYQRYLGGRGFIAYWLLRDMDAGTDPFGPGNKLIFATGAMTGMPLAGTGRNSVGGKSPLTGGFGEAEAGGFFGTELKQAGFDAVIVEGIASSPVYLWITEGKAELRKADHLWGLEIAPTQQAIRDELGGNKIRTAIIGPAGERLVRFACISNDVTHVAGRTGLGAVMGCKKLKAIAVKGQRTPPVADRETLKAINRWLAENYKTRSVLWKYGTGNAIEGYSLAGNLPTYNFREGSFDQAARITAAVLCDAHRIGMHGCWACPLRCKKSIRIEEPLKVDSTYGGPEYETMAAFGSNCGISDLPAICKAHEICNRVGLDTISAGTTIAFAMECFEEGLLTKADTDGLDLRFGNGRSMLSLLEKIAVREGLGDLLAEGTRRAATRIGGRAADYAIQVKGLEVAMHDLRYKQGQALHCAVNPGGPDHATAIQDPVFEKGPQLDEWAGVDVNESVPSTELSPRKVRLLYHNGLWTQLPNIVGLCALVPYTRSQIREALTAITGWPMSYWRLMKTAERAQTLAKVFNLREGFTERDDVLPKRFQRGHTRGNLAAVILDPERLVEARSLYYQMLGWSVEGVPTLARLVELDVAWANDYLPRT
ncbi:MAG: aldehyde ferredoxin oxidoreductase family protein [Thermodesulfobacteriota bacterium]